MAHVHVHVHVGGVRERARLLERLAVHPNLNPNPNPNLLERLAVVRREHLHRREDEPVERVVLDVALLGLGLGLG